VQKPQTIAQPFAAVYQFEKASFQVEFLIHIRYGPGLFEGMPLKNKLSLRNHVRLALLIIIHIFKIIEIWQEKKGVVTKIKINLNII
jgi:hypothetical protein